MSRIEQGFLDAVLADIVYVDSLSPGLKGNTLAEKIKNRVSEPLGSKIGERFEVLAAYDGPLTDYQGVVFKDGTDGTLYLAHRGTAGGRDLVADADLALVSGVARDQIAAMVNWWNDVALPAGSSYRRVASVSVGSADQRTFIDGGAATARGSIAGDVAAAAAAGKLRVVGHSLGGHLATVFASLFHDQVSHSSTFNGAGLFSTPTLSATLARLLLGTPLQQAAQVIGRVPQLPDATMQDNYHAANGLSLATSDLLFMQRGQRIPVYNEYTSELSLSPLQNHHQYKLTDTLALFGAFEKLDPRIGLDTLGAIAERGSIVQAASLEATLDALRRAVLGPAIAPTPVSDDGGDWKKSIIPQARIDYHQNLAALQDSTAFKALAGRIDVAPVASQGAAAVAADARSDFGAFVALRDLSAFALRPKSGQSGAEAALSGVWQATRGAEHAAWLADASARIDLDPDSATTYSDAWYADRAAMLEWHLRRQAADGPPPEARRGAAALRFDDRITGTSFDIASPTVAYPRLSKIVFGRDDVGETLSGDALRDRLYGGGGADTLVGDAGDDHLEGNAGSDSVDGGAGNDRLDGGGDDDRLDGGADDDRIDGGRGADSLDGGAGNDVLGGGSGGDALSGGAGRDRLDGGDGDDDLAGGVGDDLLRGGTGNDRYRFVAGDGDDTIDDSDGRGRIDVAGNSLAGGAAVAPGLWRNAGVTYAFTPDADGRGDLTIATGSNRIVVQHFRPGANGAAGDLGIALADYAAPALGSFNAVVGTANDNNSVDGVSGHVALAGAEGADRIQGLAGRDQLLGNAGNDLLEGGAQGDLLSGGDGDDRLFADALLDVQVFAGSQSALSGTALQGDWLDGGAGADELVGGVDADALFGGRGDDRLLGGAGNDFIFGDGEGAATNLGWHRVDNADHTYALLPASYALPALGGADFIRAGGGNDIVNGDGGDDVVFGEAGNDIIAGFEGADQLAGGDGDDFIAGDASGWFGVPEAAGAVDIIDGGAGNDVLRGNGGDDLLFGGAGADAIEGGEGGDEIAGEDGADYLDGGVGDDRIAGGAGDDFARAGEGDDLTSGDDGADTILGEAGNDRLEGGEGDDLITGGDGNDTLAGGDGLDLLTGDADDDAIDGDGGADGIWGGAGDDALAGGGGDDRLVAGSGSDQATGGDGDDALWGEEGDDLLAGDAGDDAIAGGDHDDALWGDAGNDGLWGDAGADALDGGAGHDLLDGGTGSDLLFGGAGGDRLVGGEGDDTLDGGADRDLLLGGAGNDTYTIDGAGDADLIRDQEGSNIYRLPTGVTLDNLDLRMGSDASGAANHLVVMHGGRMLAVLLGGFDPGQAPGLVLADGHAVSRWEMLARLARHADAASGEPVSLTPPTGNAIYVDGQYRLAASQAEHPVSFVSIDLPTTIVTGGAGPDRLSTLGGAADLAGGSGDDELRGGFAADTLRGNAGADLLDGVAGDDRLEGGIGDDRLVGGPGVDRLDGGEGADVLDGDGDEDTLEGGPGNDTLRGGINRDQLRGNDGDDLLAGGDASDVLAGDAGADALSGDGGNDSLDGGAGNDTLDGGNGSDVLAGGAGDDLLRGGADDDAYLVDGAGNDRILDRQGASSIRFAAGISDTSFTLTRGVAGTADHQALILDFGAGNAVTIENGMLGGVAQFVFSDGRAWTQAELFDRRWSGALALSATATDWLLSGGQGNDTLQAAAGATSHLAGGSGNDALNGAAAADRLDGGAGADTLNGAGGNDELRGDEGDDLLAGGDGGDLLRGGAGNDRLDGGAGDDRLFGEAGDDVYLLAPGAGQDVIDDGSGHNTLRLAPGIGAAAVAFRHDANDLLVALGDGSKAWIRGGWTQDRIASVAFDDGTNLAIEQVRARAASLLPGEALASLGPAPVFGTVGDDTLTGGELFGDAGNDLLRDGRRFHFARGDGADTIVLDPTAGPQVAASRVIDLAPGLVRDDLAVARFGDDLVISIRGTSDRLTVRDHFTPTATSLLGPPAFLSAIATLRFADGTSLDRNAINAWVDVTGDGDDNAINARDGGEGNDRIRLAGRTQEVRGGDGDDVLEADPYLPDDVSRLYGDAGNDVLVAGRGFFSATVLSGGAGDDVLHGASSALLDGGSGRNRLVIGSGPADNAFAAAVGGASVTALPAGSRPQQVLLQRDGGIDYVTQHDGSLGSDRHDAFTVRMSGADYHDLTVERDHQDLILGIRNRTTRTTIADFFAPDADHAGLQGLLVVQDRWGFQFLDTASPAAVSLAARAQPVSTAAIERTGGAGQDFLAGAGNNDRLQGMAGDDRLDGLSGDDVLSGGGGNDVLIGRSGADRLEGDAGDDALYGGQGDDDLQGGDGADALADASGTNVLDGGAGADTLRADGGSNALRGGDGDDLIVAVAGTNSARGGAGNDRITYAGGSADIDGGAGDDRIDLGGGGKVTVRFGRESGRDRIDGSTGGWSQGVDAQIAVGPGIAASDIALTTQFNPGQQAEDITLSIVGTTDRLTIEGVVRNGTSAVRTLRLESGEIVRVADLLARPRSGGAGNDTIIGTPGNDFLSGLAGNDRLSGLAGDDRLDGGPGMDFMEGGAGDDIYVVDDRNDAVAESDAYGGDPGGVDEVQTSVSAMMPRFVERLTLVGSGPLNAWGSAGNDVLTGNAGDNALYGQGGADRMAGGAGDDSYAVDDAGDQIVENAGEGRDVVFATVSHQLSAGVEDLWLSTDATVDGAGNELSNDLHGGNGSNTLAGGAGDDTLDGGAGGDRLIGGAGDDLYLVDDTGDTVVEAPDEGNDSVQSWVAMTLAAGVENLQLLNGAGSAGIGNALDNHLIGGAGDDRLDGGAGADTLEGGYGNDTYVLRPGGGIDSVIDIPVGAERAIVAVDAALGPADIRIDRDDAGGHSCLVVAAKGGGDALRFVDFGATPYDLVVQFADGSLWDSATVRAKLAELRGTEAGDVLAGRPGPDRILGLGGDDVLRGGDGNDVLDGGDGNDFLDGEAGADTLLGGRGDDHYVLAGAEDTAIEYPGEGNDTVATASSHALASEFENLVLTGTASIDGAGNELDNRLTGNAAANILDGGWGADVAEGGAGDDTYVVDASFDRVVEHAGEGVDVVIASASYVLPVEVEHLALAAGAAIDGTGNGLDNTLTGNELDNRLDGGPGADTLRGGPGDDVHVVDNAGDVVVELPGEGVDTVLSTIPYVLAVDLERLTLVGTAAASATGNAAANVLTGNGAANALDGAAGADTMSGGGGDDTYRVDQAGDLVVEAAAAGVDSVAASISYVLPANVENLVLTGAAPINGTGNALANLLTGNAAANVINGGAGSDVLKGGAGNDTYVVDVAGDTIVENAGEGTDSVQALVGWTLGANLENLTLAGTAAINGTGNALANLLVGNAASNRLDGGNGADTLQGGAGNDLYVVDQSGDVVVEGAGAGTDAIEAAISLVLPANVENLTLTGTAAINGAGNALANVLVGNAAGNRLDGGGGADTLQGGAGNDLYVVDHTGDVVTEGANGGEDAVQAAVSHTLAANVEHLTLTGLAAINGAGNALANALAGSDAANALDGGDGNDLLWGGAGNDVLAGGSGVDLLQGGSGDDLLGDASGNGLLDGGSGNDTLTGSAGREFLAGGAGADTLTTGGGADVIAFGRGGGADVVNASVGSDDTLSLGGGIAYADLRLRKTGLDLILEAGAGDQITFRNWYQTGVNQKSVVNLQVVADAMAGYNAASSDRLLNKRVVNFNFAGLVSRFDAALAAYPALTSFAVAAALADFYLAGSDTAAIGGDPAYDYGHRNALTDIGMGAAQAVVGAATFGAAAQTLQPGATLYAGTQRLR